MTSKTEDRQAEARERLESAVAELVTEEGWHRWLESRARFHAYSVGNTMLIAMQRPLATQVAGYRAWQALGRQVRKGERGIAILAPMVGRREDPETGDDVRVVYGFRTVHVFDVAQTDGDELPEPPVSLLKGEGPDGLAAMLGAVAAGEELSVIAAATLPANGSLDRSDRAITVGEHLEAGSAAWCKTMLHELGHWFDLGPDGSAMFDRAAAEIVAESVAFTVGQTVGLETGEYSFGYVATWARGDVDRIREVADRVDAAAGRILAGLGIGDHERQAVAA
jgi:DNA primase